MTDERKNSAEKAQPTKPGCKLALVPGRPFKKGDPKPKGSGRRKGQRNRVTIAMKDAIVAAAEIVGQKQLDAKGKYTRRGPGGLTGYFTYLAKHHDELFAPLLGRVLPYHVTAAVMENRSYRTEEEVRELCAAHGVPFDVVVRDAAAPAPPQMVDVTPERPENTPPTSGHDAPGARARR